MIVGENGSGKSNLLRAIRLVIDPSLPDSARRLQESDIWHGASANLQDGPAVEVSIELAGFDNDVDAKSVLSRCIMPGSPYRAKLTYRFSPRVSPEDVADDGDTDPISIEDYDFQIFAADDAGKDASRVKNDIGLKVLGALRDVEADLSSWRRNPLRPLLEAAPLDEENLRITAEAMAAAATQLGMDPAIPKLEKRITERLENMAGARLPITAKLGFASSAPDELVRAIRLFIDAQLKHPVGDASLGSANVLYLALLLELFAQQRESKGLVETLLAVEEPEAHLHVALQRRLFRYLLRSETAPILTTHSPHIASVAPLNSIVLLRETGNASTGTTSAGLSFTPAEAADVERYLDVTRAEILFASFVILVEGISELYLLPAIAEACGFDLDGHGVVVASIHGTDFAPYARLLGPEGLGVPFAIVTDGDAAADKNGLTEAGIRRAMRLLDPDDTHKWKDAVAALAGLDGDNYLKYRLPFVEHTRGNGIFVGSQTLETDMADLFADQFQVAFEELSTVSNAHDDVRAGLKNEGLASPDMETRRKYLKRISGIGKGRFAQRLAAHVESLDLAVIAPVSKSAAGVDETDYGKAEYLFKVLDQASRAVRSTGLRDQPDNFGR